MPITSQHPKEPGRSLRLSIIEGSFAAVHITVTGGALVTGYALMLGANDFHLGLLSALGALATVGSLVSAQLVGALGSRKRLTIMAATAGRALWALLCVLPFAPLLPGARLWLFFLVVFLANASVNMANNAWISWMTDLVPLERRGWYFGLRNTILGAVGLAANFGAGKMFDWHKGRGLEPQGFALVFGAAAASAVIAGILLTRQWEPALKGERPLPLKDLVTVPFANPDFRRLLWFFVLWSMATSVAGPFFGAHMIKNLNMPFSVIALYSIIAGILSLSLQPLWGRVIDRAGNRPVLAFNIMGIFLLPLFWLFATPDFYLPIWIDAFLTGLFWPGFGLAAFNLLLVTAPEENRTAYLAVQSVLTGLAVFAASLFGGWIANLLENLIICVFGLTIVNFHLLFVFSSVCRILLLPLAFRLKEEKAQSVTSLLNLVGDKVSQRFSERLESGIMIIRKISRSDKQNGAV
ncbi:MAG: MFS transporter [Candidatus Edwardsbacteria bacterium]|nr:MFS transporter [Candidatus Edwardsbacteria bacterium]